MNKTQARERRRKFIEAMQPVAMALPLKTVAVPLPAPHFEKSVTGADMPAVPPEAADFQNLPAPKPEASTDRKKLAIDVEAGRVAAARRKDSAFRAWCCFHTYAGGAGWIAIADIPNALAEYGVKLDTRTLKKALAAGEGLFFQRTTHGIRLIGKQTVFESLALIDPALENPRTAGKNVPGTQPVLMDVSGSKTDFCACVYAAWLGYSERRHAISRDTLKALWQVEKDTLIAWEKRAGIRVISGLAQYGGNEADALVPTVERLGGEKVPRCWRKKNAPGVLFWRTPNSFDCPKFELKPTGKRTVKRIHARCLYAVEKHLEAKHPPDGKYGATDSDVCAGYAVDRGRKQFFTAPDGDTLKARKAAGRAAKRHDDYDTPRYIQLGTVRTRGGDTHVYDVYSPDWQTDMDSLFSVVRGGK